MATRPRRQPELVRDRPAVEADEVDHSIGGYRRSREPVDPGAHEPTAMGPRFWVACTLAKLAKGPGGLGIVGCSMLSWRVGASTRPRNSRLRRRRAKRAGISQRPKMRWKMCGNAVWSSVRGPGAGPGASRRRLFGRSGDVVRFLVWLCILTCGVRIQERWVDVDATCQATDRDAKLYFRHFSLHFANGTNKHGYSLTVLAATRPGLQPPPGNGEKEVATTFMVSSRLQDMYLVFGRHGLAVNLTCKTPSAVAGHSPARGPPPPAHPRQGRRPNYPSPR